MSEPGSDRPASKVGRLIEAYDLDGLGETLEARWTAEGDRRLSLRDLADLFNERVLEAALLEAGVSTLETDVGDLYRALTDEDVSTGVRTDARSRLERNGIDIEALKRDFVTYQAVRTYLQEWRGADYEGPSDAEKIGKDIETFQRLQTRSVSIANSRIENHRDTGRITIGEFEAFASIRVLCQDCGTQYDITELLENGGCDCESE